MRRTRPPLRARPAPNTAPKGSSNSCATCTPSISRGSGGGRSPPSLGETEARRYLLGPQIDADALVDELERIGLFVVEALGQDPRLRHLVVEAFHARGRHRPDAAL